MATTFATLAALSQRTKRIRLVDVYDVQEVQELWSEEQLKIPDPEKRGDPENGRRFGITEEAMGAGEIEIRRLSDAQEKECEDLVRAVMPKPKIRKVPGKPGEPPREEHDGWDEDDPVFIDLREEARSKQTALIVLYGVVGLLESTEGETTSDKIQKIRETLDRKQLRNLAGAIISWGYSMGSTADFFTIANSGSPGQSSGSSQNKRQARKNPRSPRS